MLSLALFGFGLAFTILGSILDQQEIAARISNDQCEKGDVEYYGKCLKAYAHPPFQSPIDTHARDVYLGVGIPAIVIGFFATIWCIDNLINPNTTTERNKVILMNLDDWTEVRGMLRKEAIACKLADKKSFKWSVRVDNRDEIEEAAAKTGMIERVTFTNNYATFHLFTEDHV